MASCPLAPCELSSRTGRAGYNLCLTGFAIKKNERWNLCIYIMYIAYAGSGSNTSLPHFYEPVIYTTYLITQFCNHRVVTTLT